MVKLADFDYYLPTEAIAQVPAEPRDASRMLVLDRATGSIEHTMFRSGMEYLKAGDVLVLNNTRVTARRLTGKKHTGGQVEALILRAVNEVEFEALVKPARRLQPGAKIVLSGLRADVVGQENGGLRVLRFETPLDLTKHGAAPLPPYITNAPADPSRYQTVYAEFAGSSAAPTAGLHFTEPLLETLANRGIQIAFVTLDVGIDTFRPVTSDNLSGHKMHGEPFCISEETAAIIRSAKGRIIAVGTTSVRALESAAIGPRIIRPGSGISELFITPGFEFRIADGMITNFHMPRTTMLLLVSAMCGRDNLMRAYAEALSRGYRFLSFGDSMMILRRTQDA